MVSGTNPEEAEFILKILRTPPSDLDKVKAKKQVLFFVSSVMTWANTLPKSDGSAYTEHDFGCKVPSPKYQQLKSLEQLAMSSNKINKKLKVHVLCSGLTYGNGEANDMFYEFFRRAWLSLHPQLAALPIVGSGNNVIPTIHVTDLARSIQYLI
jgi:nucleoside-diphosphate-sugar epimerase